MKNNGNITKDVDSISYEEALEKPLIVIHPIGYYVKPLRRKP